MKENFFNLITDNLSKLFIEKDSYYDCIIKDEHNKTYKGFILAKSKTGKAMTICEISFHKSSKDKKYQPRLIFKRIDENFKEKKVRGESITQRISFQTGNDGYREFWKMIFFLKGFKDLVDIESFEDEYRVASSKEVLDYFKQKDNLENYKNIKQITDELELSTTSALYFLTTIKLLKSYRDKLNNFIKDNASEKDVQNWIDEENHEHRQDRCMIFGLEYINHKREGGSSGDRYDIFTRIGAESEERILIELKSPSDQILEVKENKTINNPKKEYSLSSSISRAIPQILEYRKTLEDKKAGDPELQKIGEENEVKISKCIIVIGSEKIDTRWKKNLREIKRCLSSNLEIWTYTDLLNKLDSTIKNLESRK